MTEEERLRITELHVDNDPATIAELRRDPEVS